MTSYIYRHEPTKVEYLFLGFSAPLYESEMLELIGKHGRPRTSPLGRKEFKNGPYTIYVNWPEVWEHKVIYKSGNEVTVHDAGCRLLPTE